MATSELSVLQFPPVLAVANTVVDPEQIVALPVIGATVVGNTFTVKVAVLVLLLISEAVMVTTVSPIGNIEPEA